MIFLGLFVRQKFVIILLRLVTIRTQSVPSPHPQTLCWYIEGKGSTNTKGSCSKCLLGKMCICDKYMYGKCHKISNTFLFLFSNKLLVFRAGIHKMLKGRPDQTAEDLGLHCLSRHFGRQLVFKILENLPYHSKYHMG